MRTPFWRCILFHFYIKPQLNVCCIDFCCVVSYSISTSNHNFIISTFALLKVVSYSISTSNHNLSSDVPFCQWVVSYSISTSNHNRPRLQNMYRFVVSYSISTSNHNREIAKSAIHRLYLIPFLHQTTTVLKLIVERRGCILFHFYIKPQLSC